MAHYTTPRIVSVRLPGEVFEALKGEAESQDRSVSGTITLLVKERVASRLVRRGGAKKLTGFLAHLDVPATFESWRAARREASDKLATPAHKAHRGRAGR